MSKVWTCLISEPFSLWGFVYAAAGAFVGFGLTILLENRSRRRNEKRQKKIILLNLGKELKAILKFLKDNINKKDFVLKVELCTPCFTALVQSGNLLMFVEEEYYDDLIQTYYFIDCLNKKAIILNQQNEIGIEDATDQTKELVNFYAKRSMELIEVFLNKIDF